MRVPREGSAKLQRSVGSIEEPDWGGLLLELRARGISCHAIAALAGVESSTVRWLIGGSRAKKRTKRPRWLVGQYIVAAHQIFCGRPDARDSL